MDVTLHSKEKSPSASSKKKPLDFESGSSMNFDEEFRAKCVVSEDVVGVVKKSPSASSKKKPIQEIDFGCGSQWVYGFLGWDFLDFLDGNDRDRLMYDEDFRHKCEMLYEKQEEKKKEERKKKELREFNETRAKFRAKCKMLYEKQEEKEKEEDVVPVTVFFVRPKRGSLAKCEDNYNTCYEMLYGNKRMSYKRLMEEKDEKEKNKNSRPNCECMSKSSS